MSTYRDRQHSPYSPAQLFALVADVERYPQFLPWCRAARIVRREGEDVLAELVLSFKGFTESYVSRVRLAPPENRADGSAAIDVTMVSGPFEYLVNQWNFTVAPEGGTAIDLFLDFRFRSRLLEKLMGGLFARAQEKMVDAFRARADALYGGKAGEGRQPSE